MLDNLDEPPDLYVNLQLRWGWGTTIRYPPGGPYTQFKDYEKAMEQMTREIFETWNKIQTIVTNYELNIHSFILENYPKGGHDQWRTNNRLWAILRDWEQTVVNFNDCHPDIKRFMVAKHTESDFLIESPADGVLPPRAPLRFLLRFFQEGETTPLSENERDMYRAIYNHSGNFFETNPVKEWPIEEEPMHISLGTYICNDKNSRARDRGNRISLLAPHITSDELFSFKQLLSFIHYRGRYHPSVFTKVDNDMTFIGRRTNSLTGPMLANRMVSFDTSTPGYRPKFWFGWEGEISRPTKFKDAEDENAWNTSAKEYDELWRRGQLFEPSEAWIMLQNQRVTYLHLLNILTTMCHDMSLNYTTPVNPKPSCDPKLAFAAVRKRLESWRESPTIDVVQHSEAALYLPPPTRISSMFFRELEFKIQEAEACIQGIFDDPGLFFDYIEELRGHHWGHIGRKNASGNPDSNDTYAIFMENYIDEKSRHMFYFDLMRGVLRRSIFEFYIWHSILSRLEEFEDLLYEEFPEYGKRDALDGDGTDLLRQLPRFLPKKKPDHEKGSKNGKKSRYDVLTEKYLSLVTMIRYHAVYFVNEFRKKGIHASAPSMRDLAFAIGDTHKDAQDASGKGKKRHTQQTICKIEKRHYGAPDLLYHSKLLDPSHGYDKTKSAEDWDRLHIFDAIENFIASPMDSTLCGIKEVANYLHDIALHPDSDFEYQGNPVMSDLISQIIGGLDILSSLADHLESLWPVMDILGGAAADESFRLKYFHSGSGDHSINFFDFDSFDFDDKIPRERLDRLFLFFDEMQGFKKESISIGHARGDLKRFGASLLQNFIYPINNESGHYYENNQEAILRLEDVMDISKDDYPFEKGEKPFNLDEEEAGSNKTVLLESQPQDYRFIAEYEKGLAKERQSRRDKLVEDLLGPSKEDQAKEKKRLKKQARRHNKARQRLKASGELFSEGEDNGDRDAGDAETSGQNYSRWGESLHATLRQYSLPPAPETRIFPVPDMSTLALSTSSDPLPTAPDGLPKGIIKKRDWATLESIYGIHSSVSAAVTYMEMKSAMNAMGYEEFGGRGGSHMNYSRENGRWPHDELPRGENILLASTHGMKSALAAKGKSRDWGRRLCQRGLTFEFINEWYVKG